MSRAPDPVQCTLMLSVKASRCARFSTSRRCRWRGSRTWPGDTWSIWPGASTRRLDGPAHVAPLTMGRRDQA
jgi:hypothetical protein